MTPATVALTVLATLAVVAAGRVGQCAGVVGASWVVGGCR